MPIRPAVRPWTAGALIALIVCVAAPSLHAQRQGRFLAKEDIRLLGLGLRVEPGHQTVPKNVATIVSTFLATATSTGDLPAFGPDAVVKATLRGPGLPGPLELTARPNTPFDIPPLSVAGTHTLDNIRLETNGEVLLFGTPEIVTIEVIEKLLVTQVISRPLTAAEIREKNIVFDRSNFQAYNFTAAFAIQDRPVTIDFPVVLPRLQDVDDVRVRTAQVGTVNPPGLPSLKTIIPDTLRIQTQVPNLTVIGFSLQLELPSGQELYSFPIPGVIIVPGNIGFLNQFFSVLLMVGNVAPPGSNVVVTDLTAEIVLPAGRDTVVGSADDPLVMARTPRGEVPRTQLIVQPGPDSRIGTADDVNALAPGESGSAEYLVEGRREGTHVVEMEIHGTLHGLPIGPIPVRGRAAGSVLVRNPTFTLTFTHPEVVNAGEAYTLDVTVTNTSQSPANFVSVNLLSHNVSGASLTGEPTREIETILPGDSATVTFELVSRVTGQVTAATLDSDDNVAGRFGLKTAVGELGVPLSPDSLVLPKEARALPKNLLDAAVGLLGKAWAVATAPAGALPLDVPRFSKQMVFDRAVEVAAAGFRVSLHELVPDSAAQLWMDFLGSDVPRLAELKSPADLPFATADAAGFDDLRRHSKRGAVFADAVAAIVRDSLIGQGVEAFHNGLAEKLSYRPPHLAVLTGSPGGVLPVRVTLVDALGRRVGNAGSEIAREIPYSDHLLFPAGPGWGAQLAMIAAPAPGHFTIRIEPIAGADAPYSLSVVLPDQSGRLRQVVYNNLTPNSKPLFENSPGAEYTLAFEFVAAPGPTTPGEVAPGTSSLVADPPPSIVGVIQQADADVLKCEGGAVFPGRIIAVLFSEEITPESAQDKVASIDITRYRVDGNQVVGVALQPGRRIALLALRDGIGPFVPRQLTVSGLQDRSGQTMGTETSAIEATMTRPGGVVSGQVLEADGTPVEADVRLFFYNPCKVGISAKGTAAQGRFSWDYVPKELAAVEIAAVRFGNNEFRPVLFTVQRDGQRLNVNIVFLGRGRLQGRTLSENGTPLAGTQLKLTSLTDRSQYGTVSDDQGRYVFGDVPVGSVFVEAVNLAAHAKFNLSEHIPLAGGTTTRDIVLLTVEAARATIKTGSLSGHVLREDGATAVAGVPVAVYYRHLSQPKVECPQDPRSAGRALDCAVAVGRTDEAGRFAFAEVTAGALRIETFDEALLQTGEAGVLLAADGSASVNILLGAGLGTVEGMVIDAAGTPIEGARVGGGLSLVTTNAAGRFTLIDVPVGRREIVAVSDARGARASAIVDLVRAGETVNATIVMPARASVAGTVRRADGTTPVSNLKVYLFKFCESPQIGICIVGTAVTDLQGAYRMDDVPLGRYTVSAFNAGLTDGNVAPVAINYAGQIARVDVTFRGGGGQVKGAVFEGPNRNTRLRARVAISGDRVVTAGGFLGTGFQHVRNFQIVDTDFTTGEFAFSGLFVGSFAVSAVGEFSPDPVTIGGQIPSPGSIVQADLVLQPTSRITGQVFRPDGVTSAGANVIVSFKSDAVRIICNADECEAIPQGIQEEVVVTGPDGQYELPIVNAGPFTLTVEDPSTGLVARVHGTIGSGETADVPVRLLGVADLTVQVRGSNKQPVLGARVEVTQLEYPRKKLTFVADGEGRAVFSGGDRFSEGDFAVLATDTTNGFAGRASAKIGQGDSHVTIDVFIDNQTGRVSGIVTKVDGTPAPNAEVVISNCVPDGFGGCKSGGPLAVLVTDANGHYDQDLIPRGPFSVETFNAASARRGFKTATMAPGDHVIVNVTEAALGMVTGTLLSAGTLTPLKGGHVSLRQFTASGRTLPELRGTSDAGGAFAFPGTQAGAFTLHAHVTTPEPGVARQLEGRLTREGEVVDIPFILDIPRPVYGILTGTVFAFESDEPTVNTRIEICHVGLNCTFPLLLTTDAEGRFATGQIPLGRFTIVARSQTSREMAAVSGEMVFEGETVDVLLKLGGLRQVSGTVVLNDANNTPVAGAEVVLADPRLRCDGPCGVQFTGSDGTFSFVEVGIDTFVVLANHPTLPLKGAVSGSLLPGESKQVWIVLEESASVGGRALFKDGRPASGVEAELVLLTPDGNERSRLFAGTGADGSFSFPTVQIAPFRLELRDPLGPGRARRFAAASGTVDLGDITLDNDAPVVTATVPTAGAVGVPQTQVIEVELSERFDRGTITAANVVLNDPAGAVPAILEMLSGDTRFRLVPLQPLRTETRYALKVGGVKDVVGHVMSADHVLTFTTVDLTAPQTLEIGPGPGTSGVSTDSVVRLKYSEPFDPTKLRGPPITVTGPDGQLEGEVARLFGNTVLVFTPRRPLVRGAAYRVQAGAVTDLSGNAQPADLDYTFSTTDGTPPQVLALTASNNNVVIENATSTVTADVGPNHDVAFVDFYLNDVLAATDRSNAFSFAFVAGPALGQPGDQITVSAFATDTSGNRSTVPAVLFITIVADQPPAVAIQSPAGGVSVRNGDHVVVSVNAKDDLGLTQIGFRALTGRPQDAATRVVNPPALERTESFAFVVPDNAAPGAIIRIDASAVDTKGHVVQAPHVELTVLDSVPPEVAITGLASGLNVRPGQRATAVVAAKDIGGISAITFRATGVTAFEQTRTIDPALPSVAAAFTFTIPATAGTGDVVNLDAVAVDKAGNQTNAGRVILPIRDLTPPTITLTPASGSPVMTPGSPVTVIAIVQDEGAVKRVDLVGTGAFTVSQSEQVSPPSGSAQVSFTIEVPSNITSGAVLSLQATALDTADNVSEPATLALTAQSLVDVTLPASVVVLAGEDHDVAISLATSAPAGGVRLDLRSRDANIAVVETPVLFAEGESHRTVTVSGVSDGTTTIEALIGGVLRASMTAAVQGGVVRGLVLDAFGIAPIAGAEVTIFDGITSRTTTTDAEGKYVIVGVFGVSVPVKVRHPETGHVGFAVARLSQPNGFANHVNVLLFAAGSVSGVVRSADGVPLAAGVAVRIFDPLAPLSEQTAQTNANGEYEFPVVVVGRYVVEVVGSAGRGRTTAVISEPGQSIDAPITLLGQGVLVGTVVDGNKNPVPNAALTLTSRTVFGFEAPVQTSANPDGTFRIANVPVGDFQLEARDGAGLGGTATGRVESHQQEVPVDVQVASFATLIGTIFRHDGVTTVPNAEVFIGGQTSFVNMTRTDADGRYRFDFVRLGTRQVYARDPATGDFGFEPVDVNPNGATVTRDVKFFGQGTIVVTVNDAFGAAVPSAAVTVRNTDFHIGGDLKHAVTGADGRVIIPNVLRGPFTVFAGKGRLFGIAAGTLEVGQTKQVVVALGPTGIIRGTVYEPGGQVPLQQAGTVQILDQFQSGVRLDLLPLLASTPVQPDGTFEVDNLPLRRYVVAVRDAQDRLRALARGVTLDVLGEVETRNLVFIGLGSVDGLVVDAQGTAGINLPVEVRSETPDFGGFATTTTNAGGFYHVDNVAQGPFTVRVGSPGSPLQGEGAGIVERHNQTVTVDVLLQPNSVNLPVSKWDANNTPFAIQPRGSLAGDPFNRQFGADQGGLILDIVRDGAPNRFVGAALGTVEDSGREVVTQQLNLAGLNVTRKVFVPRAGYFARYLEILSNPTAAPITADVRVSSILPRYIGGEFRPIGSSSGDTVLDISDPANPDRWVVFDDGDGLFTGSAAAFVFDGQEGAERAGTLTLEANPDPNCAFVFTPCASQRFVYQWNSVTIPPGGSVAYMHLVAQQRRQASALAAAARLVQLPPEALAGMSAAELQQVRNFDVAAEGNGALSPLPVLTGTVTGHLLEGGGATVVPGGFVRFASTSVLYDAEHQRVADSTGRFTVTASFTEFGNSVIVPVENFTLRGTHPLTQLQSLDTAGSFAAGTTTADQNLVFANLGLARGTVRRHTGTVVTAGHISTPAVPGRVLFIQPDGGYAIGGLPPGPVTVTAFLPPLGSPALAFATTLNIVAGQALVADLVFPPTGTLAGTVRTAVGSVAPNVSVRLTNQTVPNVPPLVRTTLTDSAGAFVFADVPTGVSRLEATEPATGIVTRADPLVSQDQTTTQDLQLVGSGTVHVQVSFAGGAPAPGAGVIIKDAGGAFQRFAAANSEGRATIQNVPVGAFTATVQHPTAFAAKVNVAGNMPSHNATVSLNATLPAVGSVQVTVDFAGGAPAANARVEIQLSGTAFFSIAGTTNASGQLTIANVIGDFIVRARHPVELVPSADASGGVTTEGQAVPIAVTLPAVGSVDVQVNSTAGSLVAGARVDVRDAFDTSFRFGPTTDANGRATITRVRGAFTIQANDPTDARFNRFATGAIATEGETVLVTIVLGTRGTVNGQVTDSVGAPASAVQVSIVSERPELVLQAATDAQGRFAFADVPTGNFRVRSFDAARGIAGSLLGTLDAHGDAVTADVVLDQTRLGGTLNDANGFGYTVDANGSVGRGSDAEAFNRSHTLWLGWLGTDTINLTPFRGDFAAAPSLDARQLSIANTTRADGGFPSPIAGLSVTRRAYVPASGYFIRYLDILENTTAAPVTVNVRVEGSMAAGFSTRLLASSDGDATLSPSDHWLVADDMFRLSRPVAALVFHGPGASHPVDQAGTGQFFPQPDKPFAQWNNLTIAPGGRAILMHFAVQQRDATSAQTSAEQIVQLPLEAIADLSAADRAAIRNFNVPQE